MIQAISTITGQLADCTIATGIEIDGVRQWAIPDIDLFAAFNVEFTDSDGRIRDLWEVRKLPPVKVKRHRQTKTSIEVLANFYQNAANLAAEASYFPEYTPVEGVDLDCDDNSLAKLRFSDSE